MNEQDLEDSYKEMLDSSYETVEICGYRYSPSYALALVDPVAYRCGMSDWESELEYRASEEDDEEDDE